MLPQTEQIRKVHQSIQPQPVIEGAGVHLKRSFPTQQLDFPDPFLLFDHFGSDNPQDYLAGFPLHPHRGIETVTYMLAGAVHHRDSIGNSGTITAGDVQWMTAGGGIMHEEMPQPVEGKMEGFQLWVNLPSHLKMTRPHYQEISSAQIPSVMVDGASVRVITGNVNGIAGPVSGIAADPIYLDVTVQSASSFTFPVKRGLTLLVYLYRGQATFGKDGTFGEPAIRKAPQLLLFDDGDLLYLDTVREPAQFLLIAGLPMHEPIMRYGPFVMNTRAEIERALSDLRNGTFIQK